MALLDDYKAACDAMIAARAALADALANLLKARASVDPGPTSGAPLPAFDSKKVADAQTAIKAAADVYDAAYQVAQARERAVGIIEADLFGNVVTTSDTQPLAGMSKADLERTSKQAENTRWALAKAAGADAAKVAACRSALGEAHPLDAATPPN